MVYNYKCPGCSKSYIGKTERTVAERSKEHAWGDKESTVYKHIHCCDAFDHIVGMNRLSDSLFEERYSARSLEINEQETFIQMIRDYLSVREKIYMQFIVYYPDNLNSNAKKIIRITEFSG